MSSMGKWSCRPPRANVKCAAGGERASERRRARVKVGEAVEFTAVAEAPAKAGLMVKAEWDFEGTGEYPVPSEIKPQSRVAVTTNYAFAKPGTHFPALRVTSNRLGDARSPYAQVQNLGRVRGSSPERIPFAGGRAQPPGAYETEELRKFMLEPVAGNFPICCGMETAAGFLFLNQQFSGFT
jgi:hypothetical protein